MGQLLVFLLVLSSISVVVYTADSATGLYESPSLTYVVDTTGSMYDDFTELKIVNSWLLDRVEAKFPSGFRQYTMVEFNDPSVGPVRIAKSKEEFGDFFNKLEATGGGDCPEMAIGGIQQALIYSPHQSFILVLTDASASDYSNTALVSQVFSLITTTNSEVVFLITGMCGAENDSDYNIYANIASHSFGHVFRLSIPDLNKAFHYLDFTLSLPINSSRRLFTGDFTSLVHNEHFSVEGNFSSLVITTDGLINSFRLVGPDGMALNLDDWISETWGSMRVIKNPAQGNYIIEISAEGKHAVRVQGFIETNIANAKDCSQCHSDALCQESADYIRCTCKDGFIGDGFNCSDIDECAYAWTYNCPAGTCQNTIGSYVCICPSGFNNSEGGCVLIDKCANPSLNKCHALATCINNITDYSCVCPVGYYGDGFHCEADECWNSICGFGIDCTKSLGSYSCFDPCVDHTVLDEPWRSTENALSLMKNCDSSKNGWYQFVGSAGVRVPETCVRQGRCDTEAPVWMNGTHPVIKDGIVDRTACANGAENCCHWTSTIKVKACPGGYHVYKLIGTPGSVCTLSYCVDAFTVNGTCKEDEEWQRRDKGYGCYCKDPYKVSDLSQIHPKLTCGLDVMRASFHKCQMKDLNIYFNQKHVKDFRCFNFEDDFAENTFSVLAPLQVGTCGVLSYQNLTHVMYTAVIRIVVETSGIITRNNTLAITLHCVYELDMIASLNKTLRPIISSINVTFEGTGNFEAFMTLYEDSSYTTPYEGSEVVLNTKKFLYIGVFVKGGDTSKFVLVMKNCYATPSKFTNDTLKYYIIQDSCPNKQDSTITVIENGDSRRGRVSVQMFKFVGDYDLVYLHCAVSLCDVTSGSCKPDCTGTKDGSSRLGLPITFDSPDLTIGPIIIR